VSGRKFGKDAKGGEERRGKKCGGPRREGAGATGTNFSNREDLSLGKTAERGTGSEKKKNGVRDWRMRIRTKKKTRGRRRKRGGK